MWARDVELEMLVLAALKLGHTRVMVPVSAAYWLEVRELTS